MIVNQRVARLKDMNFVYISGCRIALNEAQEHFKNCLYCQQLGSIEVYYKVLEKRLNKKILSFIEKRLVFFIHKVRSKSLSDREKAWIRTGEVSESQFKNLITLLSEIQELVLKEEFSFEDLRKINRIKTFWLDDYCSVVYEMKSLNDLEPFSMILPSVKLSYRYFQSQYKIYPRKINYSRGFFTEDGDYFLISDDRKILIFQKYSNRFISSISDNISAKVLLSSISEAIIYQNTKLEIVIYNYISATIKKKISLKKKSLLNYSKLSSNCQYFFCVFADSRFIVFDLNITKKILEIQNFDCYFVITQNSQILQFNRDIHLYDFIQMCYISSYSNFYQIQFLVALNEKIIFLDGIKLSILEQPSLNKIFELNIGNKFIFLTKDFKYLCTYSKGSFELATRLIVDNRNYSGMITQDLFKFVPFTDSNIFCRELNNLNSKVNGKRLNYILSTLTFLDISAEPYSETHILNSGALNVVYHNSKSCLIHTWSNGKDNNPVARNFSGEYICKLINRDYLILESNNFYYFWSLEKKEFEKYCYLSPLENIRTKDSIKERFSFTRNRKFCVLPLMSNKVMILNFTSFSCSYSSDRIPVIDNLRNFLGTLTGNLITVYYIPDNTIYSSILIKCIDSRFKGYWIVNSKYIYLVFTKKLKIFTVKTGEFLTKIKIDLIGDIYELGMKILDNYLVFKNNSNVIVIDMNERPIASYYDLENPAENKIVSFSGNKQFLIIYGRNTSDLSDKWGAINQPDWVIYIIDIAAKYIKQKFYFDSPPLFNEEILLEINDSEITAYFLNRDLFSINISFDFIEKIEPIGDLKFLHIDHTNILIIQNCSNDLPLKFKLKRLTEGKYFPFIYSKKVVLYDLAAKEDFAFYSWFKARSYIKSFMVNENFVLVWGDKMEFLLLEVESLLRVALKFRIDQMEYHSIRAAVSKNKRFLCVYGKLNIVVVDLMDCIVVAKLKGKALKVDKTGKFVIYRDSKGRFKVFDLEYATNKMILNNRKEIETVLYLNQYSKLLMYEKDKKLCYLESLAFE